MVLFLTIFYVLVCFFLIGVVLLQQGKGADLAGAFGGGGSQTAFGPRSGPTLMHKLTTGSFVLFIVLSMALAILHGKRARSVMENVTTTKPVATQKVPAQQPAAPAANETAPAAKTGSTAATKEAAQPGQKAPAAAGQKAPTSGKPAPAKAK